MSKQIAAAVPGVASAVLASVAAGVLAGVATSTAAGVMTGTTEGALGRVAAVVVVAGGTTGAGAGVSGGVTGLSVGEGTAEECAGGTGEVAAGVAKDKVNRGEVGVEAGVAVGLIFGETMGIAVGVAGRSTGELTRELGGIVVGAGVIAEAAAGETVAPGEIEGTAPETGLEPAALPDGDELEAGEAMPFVGVADETLLDVVGVAEGVFGKVPETKGVPAELKRGVFEVNSTDAGLGDSPAEGFTPGAATAGVGVSNNVEAEGGLDSAAELTAAVAVVLPEVQDALLP